MASFKVRDEVSAAINKLAKAQKVEPNEEAERLLLMGISRHNALAKYAEKGGPPKAKKGKGKKAK